MKNTIQTSLILAAGLFVSCAFAEEVAATNTASESVATRVEETKSAATCLLPEESAAATVSPASDKMVADTRVVVTNDVGKVLTIDKTSFKWRIYDWLGEEGYRPKFDRDWDIALKMCGYHVAVIFDEKDKNFIRFAAWFEMDETDRVKLLEAASHVSETEKIAKASFFNSTAIQISCEFLVYESTPIEKLSSRALDILLESVHLFVNTVRDE